MKKTYPIALMDERDRNLKLALEYWESKRVNGLLPSRAQVDVVCLRPLVGRMHLVDVARDGHLDFTFRLYGSMARLDRDRDFTNFRIADYHSEAFRRSVLEDYEAGAFSGVPSYHHVVALVDYVRYSYSRLILPLAANGRDVNMLLVCINFRDFDDLQL